MGLSYSQIFRQVLFIRIQLKYHYIFIWKFLMRICFHCEDMDQHLNYHGETSDLILIIVTLQEIFFLPLKPQGFWHSPRNNFIIPMLSLGDISLLFIFKVLLFFFLCFHSFSTLSTPSVAYRGGLRCELLQQQITVNTSPDFGTYCET